MDGVTGLESAANVVLKLALADVSEGQATAQLGLNRIDVRGLAQAMESLIRGLQVDTVSEKHRAMRECMRHLVGVESENVLRAQLGYGVRATCPTCASKCEACAADVDHKDCPAEFR